MIPALAGLAAGLAGIGAAQALAASRLVASFARKPAAAPAERPPVTVLKPLHGDEPLLEAALASLCEQDYPAWQIVFGVQSEADPAIATVRRLQSRFPAADITLTIDPALHGANRKVGNLINMFPAARHDIIVIADSDVHVRPDYLDRLVAELESPGVGLVTTLYAGLPAGTIQAPNPDLSPGHRQSETSEPPPSSPVMAGPVPAIHASTVGAKMAGTHPAMTGSKNAIPAPNSPQPPSLAARLGATQITHGFLPGAVLARALGRQDCLGATMCLRRRELDRIGGLAALVDHLADDNVLGRRIAALGMRVALAQTVPLTTVPEPTLAALFRHELRWARTIRALEPAGFAASIMQYPLFWALLAIPLAGGALWSIGLFLIAWVLRAVAALGVDAALLPLWTRERGSNDDAALAFSCPVWLLPLRDIFSVAVMLASYGGRHVDWRGHGLHADTPPPFTRQTDTLRPIQGNKTR